jgi:hypothetical protein
VHEARKEPYHGSGLVRARRRRAPAGVDDICPLCAQALRPVSRPGSTRLRDHTAGSANTCS